MIGILQMQACVIYNEQPCMPMRFAMCTIEQHSVLQSLILRPATTRTRILLLRSAKEMID